MPKKRPSPPAFLKKKLDRKTMSFVRDQFSGWVKSTEDQLGEQPRMSMELLADFIDHMGFKDRHFQNIELAKLRTTDSGTFQIYDFMRKHLGRHDEVRVPTPGKAKPQSTPPKAKP